MMPNAFRKMFSLGRNTPVCIQRDHYTMATVDGNSAEIIMYGDIVEVQPVDCWTGEPIEGQYIIESEFLKDLNEVSGCKTITIRMNSLGGDAGVSILIHNRLRELAAKGTELICIVDGVAMSGGSLIMCACDTVRVNPSSLVMIHNCWVFLFGCYSAGELRKQATQNDAWDKAQVAIYRRKCSMDDEAILRMMSDTTYMTGREAVANGFADELLADSEPPDISASADGRSLYVNGRQMHLTPGILVPSNIPTVKSEALPSVKTNIQLPTSNGGNEGGKTMAKTLEELRVEDPELASNILAEAVAATAQAQSTVSTEASAAERKRLKEIDEVAALYDEDTIREAKYGDSPCSAQEMTYRAAQKAVAQGQEHLTNMNKDYQASGASGVSAVGVTLQEAGDSDKAAIAAQAKADVEAFKKMKGVTK